MEYSANINGIDVNAFFSEESVKTLFTPLLEHLSAIHSEKRKRILVMLAAPPGAGKSTLVSFLEYLAKEIIPEKSFQSIGMDGFHRRQDYLLSNTVHMNGKEIPMVDIKGAPITFDLDCLDRLLHNPVEDAIMIDADIVLLEGNYLLLDLDGWGELSDCADYTISLSADEELLRERLITRRIATGVKPEDAEKFVDFSDMANVRLCLEKTKVANLELEISHDGVSISPRG